MASRSEIPLEESKARVESAITRAQAALEEALEKLDKMPAFDPSSVGFHAHALNNYLVVAGGIIELVLSDRPHLDTQVTVWLGDVLHATRMMGRTVSHLMTASGASDLELHFEEVDDLPGLIERVCGY